MFIKPITIRLLAYGQKANLAAIRTRAAAMLKEEHGTVEAAWFADAKAADVHAEVVAKRRDTEVELKKPSPSQDGIILTLPEVNERMVTEWIHELPVARTCVLFATWYSSRESLAWQLLVIDGERSSESQQQDTPPT